MTRARFRGVVLLEAIISLVVISSVAGACLGLRAQSIRQRVAIERALSAGDALQSILALATAGLLDAPTIELDESGQERQIWRGQWGDEAYMASVETVAVRNPMAAASAEAPEQLQMRRWSVSYGGQRVEELRMAGSR